MENTKKTDQIVFKYYYEGLSEDEKTSIRDGFLSASGIAYTSFYYKLRHEKFSKLEQSKLEELCNQKFTWQ
ncbi:hypothetical protein [Parabacteroides provencensis]|uniref:hypothetical protein n=1 Tax=Parabacteroides provencensis TaxID=1944636 RepID=UPI000C15C886|nr:hypothetical protein [Parabacteroides provencensis]